MAKLMYEYLFVLCVFMLFTTAVLYFTDGLMLRVIEPITLIIFQFTGVIYLLNIYKKTKIKWIGLLMVAVCLTFAGTVFDRFISLQADGYENAIDLFWVVSYLLYLYAFYSMVQFVFTSITYSKRIAHILLTILFLVIGFVIVFNWTFDLSILTNPKIIYFIYSTLSVILFSMALYAYLGSGDNLFNNVIGIFCAGAFLLVAYSILDNYSKLNNLNVIMPLAYVLYLSFYVITLYGVRKMLVVVSNATKDKKSHY